MIGELIIGTTAITAGGLTYARRRRVRLYRELEERIVWIANARAPELSAIPQRKSPGFSDRLAVVPDLLGAETFAGIKAEAERITAPERSFVPTHKNGGTVPYVTLIESAPTALAVYHCADLKEYISRLVGVRLQPTPIQDQSSLSLLSYDRPGGRAATDLPDMTVYFQFPRSAPPALPIGQARLVGSRRQGVFTRPRP